MACAGCQELGEIVIDPARCPNTAREFSGYEYRQDRHGNFLADYPDHDNHTIDATRYAVEALSTRRRLAHDGQGHPWPVRMIR